MKSYIFLRATPSNALHLTASSICSCVTLSELCFCQGAHKKRPDTVGELKSAEIWMSHMPSLKAKKLGKLP